MQVCYLVTYYCHKYNLSRGVLIESILFAWYRVEIFWFLQQKFKMSFSFPWFILGVEANCKYQFGNRVKQIFGNGICHSEWTYLYQYLENTSITYYDWLSKSE